MAEGPKKNPNAGKKEVHMDDDQRKNDAKTYAKLFPGEENPYAKGAEKKKAVGKKTLAKLPKAKGKLKKGTAAYKKAMKELTDIDIDPKTDKLAKVKIAGSGMTAEQIAGRPVKKERKIAKKSQKPKGNV